MVQVEHLTRVFRRGSREVRALEDVTLRVEAGEFVVVRGPSGSGKTTLLLALGGMQSPTAGAVVVNGTSLYTLDEKQRSSFRAEHIGFVFQMFHLVPYLSVVDNVMLAASRPSERDPRGEATRLLEQFGLSDRLDHVPGELSTGERQRVAVARAMLNRPQLILADEPTGNLDEENARRVVEDLKHFSRQGGTVILVTHGPAAEEQADRVVSLRGGRLDGESEEEPG